MLGASEGGLIATLSVEQTPALFSGRRALCGPIGDFQYQVNYIGDFRVLSDYFFPGVLPGSPTRIPARLIRNWDSFYVPRVKAALRESPRPRPASARLCWADDWDLARSRWSRTTPRC
jgi:hypothetical protein